MSEIRVQGRLELATKPSIRNTCNRRIIRPGGSCRFPQRNRVLGALDVRKCGLVVAGMVPGRKVDMRLHGKGDSDFHGARLVHQIMSMIRWIRTRRFSIKKSLACARQGTHLATNSAPARCPARLTEFLSDIDIPHRYYLRHR